MTTATLAPRTTALSPAAFSSRLRGVLFTSLWPVCLAGLNTIDREQWDANISHFS